MKLACIALAALLSIARPPGSSTPEQTVNQLLDTDRGFAKGASARTPVEAIAAMFADDVAMAAPGFVWARGKQKAIAAMKTNANNTSGHVSWTPARGGVSADGLHGFTLGYMTHVKPDGAQTPLKYLAYWVKGREGWRVAAYNRRPRAAGTVRSDMLPPSLPARMSAPATGAGAIAAFGESLVAAEKAFSDEAQRIGIGAAFAKHGRADASNMGGPDAAEFVLGAETIGRSLSAGSATDSSEVTWGADRALVASSGDLGVTFGMIRVNKPEAGKPSAFPFFTIWRRDSPTSPWRYIAE